MAEGTGAGGTGVRVANEGEFRAWLDQRKPPNEICVALAARAALRALPLVATARFSDSPEGARQFAELAAAVFRATALARVATTYPTRANELRASDAAASDAAARAAAASDAADAAAAAHAAYAAAAAADAAAYADYAAYAAADAAASAASDAAAAYWDALSTDLQAVEAGASSRELAARPLWPNEPPEAIAGYWRALSARLPQSDGWRVWTRWYEARLKGERWSEEREVIYATVPVETWDEGPAAANAWIAERLGEARAPLEPSIVPEEISPEVLDLPPPPPVENVPSVFTYGANAAGQIDITAGPQNIPFIAHPGDEETHRRWLDAARKLAERLAKDLRAGKFNANLQYRDRLENYAADLPTNSGDGNIILADAEARALHRLFAAETSALNEGFAARLSTFLESHFALLAFYEDEMRRFQSAAATGSLHAPFPQEAVAKVEAVVRAHTPDVFAPRVSEGLREAERLAPNVELEPEDLRRNAPIQPPPYPFGDTDYEKARRLGVGGSINALYKAILELVKNDPEKAVARIELANKFYEAGKLIFQYLK